MALSIVVADKDEKYLGPLELKFAEEFGEKADITVITDENYLKTYFSTPQNIDLLLINEELYSDEYEKQNIRNVFLLCESESKGETENIFLKSIYKYTSIKKIFNDVVSNMSSNVLKSIGNSEEGASQVIMIYSPSGGTGKTFVSLGIATALAECNKRVLFISTEILQNFNYILNSNEYLNNGFEQCLSSHNEDILKYFNNSIGRNVFDYLLPFRQATSSYNIQMDDYRYLIEELKASKEYDFIVLDTSSELTNDKTKMMSYSNKVITVTMQNEETTTKLESLLVNIDCSNKNKFIFVCNNYIDDEVNHLIRNNFTNKITISEYIPKVTSNSNTLNIEFLAGNKQFQKIAYMLI